MCRVLISPHPCQYLLFSIFLIIAILMGVKSYLIMVLICIYLPQIIYFLIQFCLDQILDQSLCPLSLSPFPLVLHSECSQFCTDLSISFSSPSPTPGFHPIQLLTGSLASQTLSIGMDLKSHFYNTQSFQI